MIDLGALYDDKLWDLLGAAQAQVQDIGQFVCNKSEAFNLDTGSTSIKELIDQRNDWGHEKRCH